MAPCAPCNTSRPPGAGSGRNTETSSTVRIDSRSSIRRKRHAMPAQSPNERPQMTMVVTPSAGGCSVDGPANLGGARGQGHGRVFLDVDCIVRPRHSAMPRDGCTHLPRFFHEILVDDLVKLRS